MERYNQLDKILRKVDFPYAVIKGEVLSLACYNKIGIRPSGDIDILLERKNLKQFENILQSEGFFPSIDQASERIARIFCISNSHQLLPMVKNTCNQNIEIDINFDIFWGEYDGKRCDMGEFLSDTMEINLYGVNIKILPPMKALIQLMLHHYKDMNSIFLICINNSITYEKFKDLYYFLKNNIDYIQVDTVETICNDYNIKEYIYYMFYYINLIYKGEFEEYVQALKTKRGDQLLNCYGLTDRERKIWKVDYVTRLQTKNLFQFIQADLTEHDWKKIEQNTKLFCYENKGTVIR